MCIIDSTIALKLDRCAVTQQTIHCLQLMRNWQVLSGGRTTQNGTTVRYSENEQQRVVKVKYAKEKEHIHLAIPPCGVTAIMRTHRHSPDCLGVHQARRLRCKGMTESMWCMLRPVEQLQESMGLEAHLGKCRRRSLQIVPARHSDALDCPNIKRQTKNLWFAFAIHVPTT